MCGAEAARDLARVPVLRGFPRRQREARFEKRSVDELAAAGAAPRAQRAQDAEEREQARAGDGTVAAMLNSDAFLGRPMLRRAEFDARLRALTVEEVNAAIRKFIKPEQLSVFVAGDFAGAEKTAR